MCNKIVVGSGALFASSLMSVAKRVPRSRADLTLSGPLPCSESRYPGELGIAAAADYVRANESSLIKGDGIHRQIFSWNSTVSSAWTRIEVASGLRISSSIKNILSRIYALPRKLVISNFDRIYISSMM